MIPESQESEKTPSQPLVTLEGYQEYQERIEEACIAIFGRALAPEEIAELIAAPDGSVLTVKAESVDGIELRLGYRWFKGEHEYLVYVDEQSDQRVVEFVEVAVLEEAPDLLETRLFARQVESFRRFSLDQIRLFAAGYPDDPSGFVGYYVWARLGFLMSVDGLGPKLAEDGFEGVNDTLDLFRREGGGDWWYNHGSERDAVFYLSDDSGCVAALHDYLEEKGVPLDGDGKN